MPKKNKPTLDATDKDLKGLELVIKGLEMTTERIRRPTLEFAWDRYVSDPIRKKKADVNKEEE